MSEACQINLALLFPEKNSKFKISHKDLRLGNNKDKISFVAID